MTSTARSVRMPVVATVAGSSPRSPRWWALVAVLAAALSMLVVVLLWAGHGGPAEIAKGDWAAVAATGRLIGLLASDLLLIQVLLMARIPLVERSFGQDRLARWHRWTGFTSFWLMLTHIALITLGYAGPLHRNALDMFVKLVLTYPGMLLAAAGAAALIMVVVTSLRMSRRRLRYESWHLLHLYAYLGVGLALPHQLWNGADFVRTPAARVYWWTLYGTAAGAVLFFRILRPVWRNLRHRLEVTDVVPEAPGLTSVYLRGRRLERLPARAGQFFLWRFRSGPGWTRAHPFSLSATPRSGQLRITVKDDGDGSGKVASLRPGTRALIEGPFGKLTGESYAGGPVAMFACGVGITPLLALLWDLPYGHGEAILVYRVRRADDIAFRSELDYLAEHRGLRVITLVGHRAAPDSWLPHGAPALRRLVPDIARHHVYLCGPQPWMDSLLREARAAGVPRASLRTERFAWF